MLNVALILKKLFWIDKRTHSIWIENQNRNSTGRRYSDEVKKFAQTLQYYRQTVLIASLAFLKTSLNI